MYTGQLKMQTLNLVKYYLKNGNIRDRICEQGQISAAPHNYKYRAEYMINVLKKENIINC